jgi:hypothetical protein
MKEAFKDHGIFQGVYQYYDESGIQWRVMKEGIFYYFYEQDENCFVHVGNFIFKNKKASLKTIHYAFIEDLLKRDCCNF